jgi:hypothetical protein
MASNAVIVKRLRPVFIFLFVFVAAVPLYGGSAAAACVSHWQMAPLGSVVLGNPTVSAFIKQNKNDATLDAALRKVIDGWSDDFLVAAALELEQRVLSRCSEPALGRLLTEIQQGYLRKVGWVDTSKETALLFKGLLNTGEESATVRERVGKLTAAQKKESALKVLALVYGDAAILSGVLVVGAKPLPLVPLQTLVQKVCGRKKPCPLWDSASLARVAILPVSGFASYVPELASLRLSRELLEKDNRLHQLVIAHELAHSAQARSRNLTGVDWRIAFAKFSEWKRTEAGWVTPVRATENQWADAYDNASLGSSFSVLPDPVMLSFQEEERKVDGFVFARSERETKRAGDVGEDLADHIAAYILAPERFCFRGKPVAPQKFEWVAREVFGQTQVLRCVLPKSP